MLYNVLKVESKNNDWKVVDVAAIDGTTLEGASINRTDKKTNSPFPNFDVIQEGYRFEANPWTNTSGKHYLFPPRPQAPSGGSKGGFNVAKAQETKREDIKEAQTNKNEAIKISSTARDASSILVALMAQGSIEDWKSEWLKIRAWLWTEFDNTNQLPPF